MNVKTQAIMKALSILKVANAKYVVISEGNETYTHGDLVVQTPRRKRKLEKPYGTYSHILASIKLPELKIGDVIAVDASKYDVGAVRLRYVMNAKANKLWGKESHVSTIEGDAIEFMRIG